MAIADPEKIIRTDEETSIASCRAWYDETDYGKAYCCQMMTLVAGFWDVNVFDATETIDAPAIKYGGMDIKFSALTFDGAQ